MERSALWNIDVTLIRNQVSIGWGSMGQSPSIQSVERAFAVLRALRPHGKVVSLATIATRTGLPKSTTSRLLSTMAGIGVVEKVSEAGYMVGRELRTIVYPGVGPLELVGVSATYLRDIVGRLGEDAALAMPDGNQVLYIDQVQKRRPVQVQNWTGERFPLHTTAAGYVFLSSWSDDAVSDYLAGDLDKLSPATVTDPARLREMIRETRSKGYAWSYEVWSEGINGAAAPIADGKGEVVGAVTVFGPAYRFPGERDLVDVGRCLVEAASHVARYLRTV